jgi:primosomal protein N' (replication factor Y)
MIEATLEKKAFRVFLLQGVTGSGKTEIYIRLIKKLLKAGKTAMVLVPEIALTPQTAHRFRNAFGDSVAVLHSGMRLGERFDQWRRIRAGQYRVVVGARSALFAPLSDLGMIVVDEEHESSYKQNRNPRYHAVDVAIKRAEVEGCPVILGSATPAIESCHKARSGRFGHILLTKRVENRKLPSIEIVDMKEEFKQGNRGIFSLALQEEMHKCLTMEDKFILFINRRGYASFLLCRDCGYVPKCNRCAVSFTYHRDRMRLVCHHCNCNTAVPTNCPECGSRRIGDFGIGTQKVESELDKLIPGLNIIRMDADTTKGRDSHRKKLIEFYHQKRSVLLGTQMIAKGLDFPEVTLVGIINGDTALNLPDFRAAERTFQLLMQVSGRAGRGSKPGKVVLQTYFPESYALSAVSVGDYDGFFEQEIDLRRELLYPPFCQLINIVISGSNSNRVEAVAQEIIGLISDGNQNEITEVLGPAPAPLSKIKGHHRWHIILKVSDSEPACRFLQERLRSLNGSKLGRGVNLTVDVDPVWML